MRTLAGLEDSDRSLPAPIGKRRLASRPLSSSSSTAYLVIVLALRLRIGG
jgi:hypothetical protein